MRHKRRRGDVREYRHSPELDRIEGVAIVERHFPEINIGEVKWLSVEHSEGYATVKVYRYAQSVVTKSFPASGLLAP